LALVTSSFSCLSPGCGNLQIAASIPRWNFFSYEIIALAGLGMLWLSILHLID